MTADPVFGLPVGDGPHDPDRIPSAFGGSPADRGSVTKIARNAGLPDGWADPGVTPRTTDAVSPPASNTQDSRSPHPGSPMTPGPVQALTDVPPEDRC